VGNFSFFLPSFFLQTATFSLPSLLLFFDQERNPIDQMSTVCVQAFRCAAPAAAAGASRNSGSGCSTSKSPSSSTSTMMKLSSRSSFLPSARRCLVISRAKKADKGGFGKADPSKQAAPVKVRADWDKESSICFFLFIRRKKNSPLSYFFFFFFFNPDHPKQSS